MVDHVVKHVHVFPPVRSILHTPPSPEGTLVWKPHGSVDVTGVTDVDGVLVEQGRDLIAIVSDAGVSILLLIDIGTFHGESRGNVVVEGL